MTDFQKYSLNQKDDQLLNCTDKQTVGDIDKILNNFQSFLHRIEHFLLDSIVLL